MALSAKVLCIAIAAIHATAGHTVETCYQAITLLGFDRMKDIAVGAAVFDHLNNRSAALEELMAVACYKPTEYEVFCVGQTRRSSGCVRRRLSCCLWLWRGSRSGPYLDVVRAPLLFPVSVRESLPDIRGSEPRF